MVTVKKLDTSMTGQDMKIFTYKLLNSPLFLPDLLRNYESVLEAISRRLMLPVEPLGAYGKDGKLGGVFWLSDIVPDHDANLLSWVWSPDVCTADTMALISGVVEEAAKMYGLRRVSARTACDKMERILRCLGLKTEGRMKYGFRHQGKYHTLVLMRKLMEVSGQ